MPPTAGSSASARSGARCDVPAGGGYLADGLRGQVHDTKKIFCVEPSQKFSEPISTDYTLYNCTISNIPVDDNSFDRIGSLAGLHHIDNKLPFFREAARLLKPNGLIGIGDVLVGSAVAKFLNGPVDRYTMSGHKGIFIRRGDYFQWFKNSGLEPKLEKYHEFHWSFDSLDQMVDYCKSLFGLVNANRSQVREALHSHFDIRHHGDKVLLPWSIIYGVGKKVA